VPPASSYRAFLALLCASVGCFGGAPDDGDRPERKFGGPTSDWPGRNNGDEAPSKGASDDSDDEGEIDEPADQGTVPPPTLPGAKDAGKGTGGVGKPMSDAGVANSGGSSGAMSDAGSPSTAPPSVDQPESSDGGSADGGAGGMCTAESDRRGFGACFGVYCAMTPGELAADAQSAAACSSDLELMLACDGEISRVVAQCAEDNVLTLGAGRTVTRCAERADALSEVGPACLDCYVEEVLCAATQCLTACLSSDARSCSDCRLLRCGEDFRACSGLPSPPARY
jgi:hypothetical protein